MSNKHYIQSYYDGTLFEYSKEAKEGYKEFTNTKGKLSYRKYYNKGVEGELKYVSLRNNEYLNNREELNIVLESGEDSYQITFPVMDNQGDSVDRFVESFVRVMPALKKGVSYSINNWRMKKGDVVNGEEVKYTNQGVSVKSGGVKVEPVLTYVTENDPKGDIPRVEWNEIAGKNRPSAASKEAKLVYLYETLKSQVARLGYEEDKSESTKEESKPATVSEESPQKVKMPF